jgi:hypothetical protein
MSQHRTRHMSQQFGHLTRKRPRVLGRHSDLALPRILGTIINRRFTVDNFFPGTCDVASDIAIKMMGL